MCTRACVRKVATTWRVSRRCVPGWSGSLPCQGTCPRPVRMTLGLLLLESTDEASSWEEILNHSGREVGEGAPYHSGGDRGRSAQTPRPPLGLAQVCRLHADSCGSPVCHFACERYSSLQLCLERNAPYRISMASYRWGSGCIPAQ